MFVLFSHCNPSKFNIIIAKEAREEAKTVFEEESARLDNERNRLEKEIEQLENQVYRLSSYSKVFVYLSQIQLERVRGSSSTPSRQQSQPFSEYYFFQIQTSL